MCVHLSQDVNSIHELLQLETAKLHNPVSLRKDFHTKCCSRKNFVLLLGASSVVRKVLEARVSTKEWQTFSHCYERTSAPKGLVIFQNSCSIAGRHASRTDQLDSIDEGNASNHSSAAECRTDGSVETGASGDQPDRPVVENHNSQNLVSSVLPQLTALLDTRLQEMEQRICDRLSKQLARTEQRLMRVMLNRSTSQSEADSVELDVD